MPIWDRDILDVYKRQVNQSITGTFSSSDPRFFKEFMEEADHCYEMNMSNRSSADILELANNLVEFVCNDLEETECREALQQIEIETVEKGQGYKENPNPDKYQINAMWYKTFEEEDVYKRQSTHNITLFEYMKNISTDKDD